MARNNVVLLDYIPIVSKDGTWNIESLELEPREEVALDEFGLELSIREGRENAKLILPLYKSGELQKMGHTDIIKSAKGENVRLLDFIIPASKLPDEIWAELENRIPRCACDYSGCTPCVHMIMKTYRDNCGCISKSYGNIPTFSFLIMQNCIGSTTFIKQRELMLQGWKSWNTYTRIIRNLK